MKTWQDNFVSSGIPLELAIARQVVALGASVVSDYTYTRQDGQAMKDCSCDLLATSYLPWRKPNDVRAVLEAAIECKQRAPKKAWVFFPDLNKPDFSQGSFTAIRSFPLFTAYDYASAAVDSLIMSIPLGLKGVEINMADASVHDSDIRSGINQLRYALPSIIKEQVIRNNMCHTEDTWPFFVVPILCTNAPLYLLRKDVDSGVVARAKDILEIADAVTCVDLHASFGTDFAQHCARETKGTVESLVQDYVPRRHYGFIHKNAPDKSPLVEFLRYELGLESGTHDAFSQFLVCHSDHVIALLRKIARAILRDLRGRKIKKIWEESEANNAMQRISDLRHASCGAGAAPESEIR